MTLRNRLILGVLGLIAVLGVVIGSVSTIALNGYLMDRLDGQLSESMDRAVGFTDGPNSWRGDGPEPDPSGFINVGGQVAGTLGAYFSGGELVDAAVLDGEGSTRPLSDAELTILLETRISDRPQTVNLGDLGDYRIAINVDSVGNGMVIGVPLAESDAIVRQLILVTVIVTLISLVLAAVVGTLVIRLALRPLDRVVATATRVTQIPLDRGEVALAERVPDADANGRTEVGRVGQAINRMLEHVAGALTARHKSEDQVRQFVADASHELRTPLASIRGYAELTRRGNFDLPPDVTRSLSRIESESSRMTTLVEELLLLARLDAKPELERGDVDLSALAVDALSDAIVASDGHEWELEVPEQPVIIQADGPRMYQVMTNLLANARVHTPAGTRVVLALEPQPDGVDLVVSDNGPGIDPAILPTLFERFVRADSSRQRSTTGGSTGLGLAIVDAVVSAHDGTVTVASEPGATVFRVHLPA